MNQGFGPAGAPQDGVRPSTAAAAARLGELFTAEQLDGAVESAARKAQGTVAWFVAAPVERPGPQGAGAALEFVVEFFIPPSGMERLRAELSSALQRTSLEYATGRRTGLFSPPEIITVPAGTFHQWRLVFRRSEDSLRAARWSPRPELLESVLHQSQVGWREMPW